MTAGYFIMATLLLLAGLGVAVLMSWGEDE
jgi:hypothetical protein